MALARPFAIRPNYVRVERRALKIMRVQSKIKMDTIKIIWLTDDKSVCISPRFTMIVRQQRAAFEMEAGDFEAASRIFAEMIKTLKAENPSADPEILAPNRHEVERGEGS